MTSTKWSRPSDGSASELYTLFQKKGYKYKTNPGAYCYPDYPSGQLWSTSTDLAKFALAMLKRGKLESATSNGDDCLYSEETGALVFQKSSPSTGDGDSALGWFVGKPYYTGGAGHDGSETGISSDIFIDLNSNVAIGYWANGELSDSQYMLLYNKFLKSAKKIGSINNEYLPNKPKDCQEILSSLKPPILPTSSPTEKKSDCVDSSLQFRTGSLGFKDCGW
eukprot:CAMPEP_0184869580 /NCGR_PEP_ID=MMETSP0580-20130426/34607_1 /TAXON_ID=1118495 /ORGANISM="Dactyliosolen fragilissimus" /LENGTH=221 /DNA_ID=CAMNT_0027371155 /DNA_START=62 /DNA_END=724 /DNA_ORIENTATION=+